MKILNAILIYIFFHDMPKRSLFGFSDTSNLHSPFQISTMASLDSQDKCAPEGFSHAAGHTAELQHRHNRN